MKNLRKSIVLIMALAMVATFAVTIESNAANDTKNTSSQNTNNTSNTDRSADSKVIPEGVTIEGTDVAGQTATKAKKVVEQDISSYNNVTFTLVAGDKQITATSKDLGVCAKNSDVADRAANYGSEGDPLYRYKATKDLESGKGKDFKISPTALTASVSKFLEKNKASLETKVVNNGLKHENGSFQYAPGTAGTTLDINASADKIANYISSGFDGKNATIDLVYSETQPKGSQEELTSVKDVLGSFNTDFSSSAAGRAKNVKNGCAKINGTILYPGDTFSVTDAVVPFTAENGYELAGSYENGTTVETYGGGICQVSSTLYNAVIRAELEVVARNNHSMIVTYVDPSADAAIAEGILDFKFKNNQETPIYIEGYCNGGKIYFSIYGKETRDKNRTVEFQSETTSTTEAGTSYEFSADLPAGTITKKQGAHTGYTARLWKIVKVNGQEESRKIFNNSTYKVSNAIYTIGTGGISAEGKAAIDTAIASNDDGAVRAAVGSSAGGAAPAQPTDPQQSAEAQAVAPEAQPAAH